MGPGPPRGTGGPGFPMNDYGVQTEIPRLMSAEPLATS
jgi:hypothetical protein